MDSGILFGCLLGMVQAPMLKCTCNLCCTPFQTTLLVKNNIFEKMAQRLQKIRHATLPTLAAQSLHSEFLSPFNFATHEKMKDHFAMPQVWLKFLHKLRLLGHEIPAISLAQ